MVLNSLYGPHVLACMPEKSEMQPDGVGQSET